MKLWITLQPAAIGPHGKLPLVGHRHNVRGFLCAPPSDVLDDSLEVTFQNAELATPECSERIFAYFFNPGRERRRRSFGLSPIESRVPGEFLAVARRRLLWITEGHQDSDGRGGAIVRSVPLENVVNVSVHHTGRNCGIIYRFRSGAFWCVPLPVDQLDAGAACGDRALAVIDSLLFEDTD